jgi:hypothetical protein
MATINDLNVSISELTEDLALKLIQKLRNLRRIPLKKKVKTGTKKKVINEQTLLSDFKNMPKELQQKLINGLKEML